MAPGQNLATCDVLKPTARAGAEPSNYGEAGAVDQYGHAYGLPNTTSRKT